MKSVALVTLLSLAYADNTVMNAMMSNMENPFTCLKDLTQLYNDVKTTVSDVQNKKDISSLIADIQTLITDVKTALPDCGVKVDLTQFVQPIENIKANGSCISDIESLVSLAQKLVSDVKAKDISSLINDGTAFISGAQ